MLAVVAGAVAAFCLYRQINDQIRRRVETKLAQHYKDLKVSIRSAQLVEGKGIKVYDLSISDPNVEGPAAELLHVEEALFECPTDWKELIKGDPPIQRVTIRRPTIRVTRRSDGTWNLNALLPPPHFGNTVPDVSWENGVIEVIDPQKDPASKLVLRDVNLAIAPAPADSPGTRPVVRQLRGTLAGDGLRRVRVRGMVRRSDLGVFDPREGRRNRDFARIARFPARSRWRRSWRRWASCAGRWNWGFKSITTRRPPFRAGLTWRDALREDESTIGGCRKPSVTSPPRSG